MPQNLMKYVGVVQGVLGLLGQFAPQVASFLGPSTGGNVLNILSGGALAGLGFKGSPSAQQTGAKVIGGLNALAGLLPMLGVGGLPASTSTTGNLVNLAVGALGLYTGFMGKKTAAA